MLLGLKENVIMGHLIPAGTGIKEFRDIIVEIPNAQTETTEPQPAAEEAESSKPRPKQRVLSS
jgi:DNA-directed RNA polymerase subunit beta'